MGECGVGMHSVSKVCRGVLWEETWKGDLAGGGLCTRECGGRVLLTSEVESIGWCRFQRMFVCIGWGAEEGNGDH